MDPLGSIGFISLKTASFPTFNLFSFPWFPVALAY